MAIPQRIDIDIAPSASLANFTGAGTNYLVKIPNGKLYCFYIDSNIDPAFKTSLDQGLSWSSATVLKNCSCTALAVWYDRWSGIDADLIHVAYTDAANDDVFYRNVNAASSDTLSTEYTVFAGSTTADGGTLSIARMRGGNLVCGGSIDAGAEMFCYKSANVGATWSSIAAVVEATQDQIIMMPGWAADNQDAICFYWDASADEISIKTYDDSGDAWGETSIATSIADTIATTSYPHFAAAVDLANSQHLLVFWTVVDTANADLRLFKCTEAAQTESDTNVVLNSTDDQGLCAVGVNTSNGYWYVAYGGKSDGSETFFTTGNSSFNLYYKISKDGGATWESETLLTNTFLYCYSIKTVPSFASPFVVGYFRAVQAGIYQMACNAPLAIPRATFQLGI